MKNWLLFIIDIIILLAGICYRYDYYVAKSKDSEIVLKSATHRRLISCERLIDKFNNILLQNDLEVVDLEFLTSIDDTYYVGLYQDVILFITPHEHNNLDEDIVYQCGIIFDSDTLNLDLAKKYYQYLIEANNEYIFDAHILVNNVLDGDLIERNNGVILASVENEGEVNLFIERKYNT